MRISYNSPVVLTFSILSAIILGLDSLGLGIMDFFTAPGTLNISFWGKYIGLITHVMGHADWTHLLSNITFLLLLGPILEEKYGSSDMLIMIIIVSITTGILNLILFDRNLLGASGVVFMFILLSSITNYKNGDIPLTFILVVILFLGKEVIAIWNNDNISQFAHI